MRRKLLCFVLFANCAFFTTAAMADTPPQITGVTVTNLTDTAATITWITDISSTSVVQYSASTNPPLSTDPTVAFSTLVTSHAVQLTSLLPGTQYFYSVTSCSVLGSCSTASSFGFITLAVPGTWKQVASPSVTSTNASLTIDNHLLSITATSLTDAWAVGYTEGSTRTFPVLEHWDGTQWTKSGFRYSKTTNSLYTSLYSVSVVKSDFAWAVGEISGSPFILQWNGSAWNQIPAATLTTPANTLEAVHALDTNHAFTAGRLSPNDNSGLKTLIEIYSVP